MKKNIQYCIVIIFYLASCADKRGPIDSYDHRYFKLNISNDSIDNGYQTYYSIVDTSMKMLKYYWPNGKLQLVAYFKNGKKDGVWYFYLDTEVLFSKVKYLNGKKNGLSFSFHNNGEMASCEKFYEGKPIDTSFYYDTSGKLTKEYIYK